MAKKVRPLSRSYAGRESAATAADEEVTWKDGEHSIRAQIWRDLVLPGVVSGPQAHAFDVYAIADPRFAEPWVLATAVKLTAQTVRAMYIDRWPIEQLPLSAKHMVGTPPAVCRCAAEHPALAGVSLADRLRVKFFGCDGTRYPHRLLGSGPRPTPGRLRRTLQGQAFPESYRLPQRIRKKASVTEHLPKGISAHRRQPHRAAAVVNV